MATFNKLVKKRASYRSSVLKSIQSSEKFLAEGSVGVEDNLNLIKSFLEKKLVLLTSLDDEILELSLEVDEEGCDAEAQSADEFAIRVNMAIQKIENFLRKAIKRSDSVEPDSASIDSARNFSLGRGRVKLPKLELSKFNGDPRDYQTWRDSFDSAIHLNDTLAEVDKFNYLRSLLVGPALSAIAGLSVTKENYAVAIELVANRFGQKHVVISSHMDSLMKIPMVGDMDDARGLRQVYDRVESNLRSLKSLGVGSESYGCLLVPVILSRLPEEMRLIISRQINPRGGVWELDHLLEVFKSELEARERAGLMAAGSIKQVRRSAPVKASAAAMLSATDEFCVFCKGKHAPIACKILTEPSARKAHLRKLGRCFVCLKPGHVSKYCRSKSFSCTCGGTHHKSLCEGHSGKGISKKIDDSPIRADNLKPQQVNSLFVDGETSALLQTAKARVSDAETIL